jgi:hypothetical protein
VEVKAKSKLKGVDFSGDGRFVRVLVGGAPGDDDDRRRVEMMVFSADSGRREKQYELGKFYGRAEARPIEVTRAQQEDTIRVFDWITNKTSAGPLTVNYRVKEVGLSNIGSRLVTLDEDGVVRVTDLAACGVEFSRLSARELLEMACWQLSFAPEDVVAGKLCKGVQKPPFVQQMARSASRSELLAQDRR